VSSKIIINDLKSLTSRSLKQHWDKNFKYLKYNFGLRLNQYAIGKKYDYTTNILPDNEKDRTKIIKRYRSKIRTSTRAK
jgi:hypothetical protein